MAKVTALLAALAFSAAILTGSEALDCGDDKIRGVNLGGWLLLEPWITPSIFQEVNEEHDHTVVDEYTYAQFVDKDFAAERLDRHWDTFYSLEDLEKLYAAGVSHIRIPIGYWLVDVAEDEPFPPPPQSDNDGQRFYLKRLLGWAEQVGLKILIDLHGAPGSQNGFDNSGRRGEINWYKDGDRTNVERTLVILDKITLLMADWIADGTISQDTLYGIELLNEPWGITEELWEECRDRFYPLGYSTIRSTLEDSVRNKVVIQQAFRASSDFYGYMSEAEGYEGVALDMHIYQCFGEYWNDLAEVPEGWNTHLDAVCAYRDEVSQQTLDTFTGEWSLAVTDCQEYLNGGYDNPYVPPDASASTCEYYNGDFDNYTQEYLDFLRDFFLSQVHVYQVGKGWFFWTGKTENNCAPEWDFIFLLDHGVIPNDLCQTYTNHCNPERK